MKLAQKIAINYIRARLNIIAVVSKRRAAKKAFEIFSTPFRKSGKKTPRIFDKAEKLAFELDGVTIKGYRFNHPSENRVMIIHGFESNVKNFDRYISPLVKKGYEVLAFDAPAHGRSGGKRIILPQYKAMLAAVNQHFGPVQRFMAHSFGGLALAHMLEEMPHDENTRAVFIAPATETVTAIDSFFRFLDLNEEIRREFDRYILEESGVPAEHYSIRRAMHHIKAQILWIHDESDDMTPLKDALAVKADHHPNIEFVITQGLGHRRIYRENKVVKQIVDFL
jgi:predicted alpha/beta hydrolase family esterase